MALNEAGKKKEKSEDKIPKTEPILLESLPEQERNNPEVKNVINSVNSIITLLSSLKTVSIETIKALESKINRIVEITKNFSSQAKNIINETIDSIRKLINYKSGKEVNAFIENELANNPNKYCTDLDIIKH